MKNVATEHFFLFASNLNRQDMKYLTKSSRRENTPTYLFCTNFYRFVFTFFNVRSVQTVPKNKPSISCNTFHFYSHVFYKLFFSRKISSI